MNLDETDRKIIDSLKNNSRLSWKEIGGKVHMTGQAVAARIERLIDSGVIRKFTIDADKEKMGITITGYITVYMKTTRHDELKAMIKSSEAVTKASRISGDGCYLLLFAVHSQGELGVLLDAILLFGTYRLCISVEDIV